MRHSKLGGGPSVWIFPRPDYVSAVSLDRVQRMRPSNKTVTPLRTRNRSTIRLFAMVVAHMRNIRRKDDKRLRSNKLVCTS